MPTTNKWMNKQMILTAERLECSEWRCIWFCSTKSLILKDHITSFLCGVSSLSIVFDFWFECVIVSWFDFVLLKFFCYSHYIQYHSWADSFFLCLFLALILSSFCDSFSFLLRLCLIAPSLRLVSLLLQPSILGTVFVGTIFDWSHTLLPISSRLSLWVNSPEYSISSQSSSPLAQQSTIHLSQTNFAIKHPGSSLSSSSSCTSSEHCGRLNSPITMKNRKVLNIIMVFFVVVKFCSVSQPCIVYDKFDYSVSVTFFILFVHVTNCNNIYDFCLIVTTCDPTPWFGCHKCILHSYDSSLITTMLLICCNFYQNSQGLPS